MLKSKARGSLIWQKYGKIMPDDALEFYCEWCESQAAIKRSKQKGRGAEKLKGAD